MNNFSPTLHKIVSLLIPHPLVFDQICNHQGHRSRHPSQTVHHYITPLQRISDEVSSLVEMYTQVESLMILSRNIQTRRN